MPRKRVGLAPALSSNVGGAEPLPGAPTIFAEAPKDWRELQTLTADVLKAAGFEAAVDKNITLVRGRADVDVWAVDTHALIPITYICECKFWKRSVPKEKVHAFRTLVGDAGAHVGFLISRQASSPGRRKLPTTAMCA